MSANPVARWHQVLESRDPRGLSALLAEAVVFHSPVMHPPQVGRALTSRYLTAAFRVFVNDSFRYIREVVGPCDAVLEFQVEIDGIEVNGVDMLRWDEAGRIVEVKVMLRPLKAIDLIHGKMAALLQAGRTT